MPNTNKIKGKYFEEKIAKDYRDILKLSKLDCYRSSNSGARESIEYTGDITFKDPLKYNLITECKYYSSLKLEHIYPICNSYIDEWINQVFKEREHYKSQFNKEPLSIIIASKPYLKDHYIIIVNDNDCFNQYDIIPKIVFYSKPNDRFFTLVSYSSIRLLFNSFSLIDS